ncbi:MAG: NPCBM/NEW2 domain-containing protein [Kiritimatiellae bacterium]|nr:NPCBM/NEW2 domain-containing protein [Kiritimatiellia bacterium]
MNENDERPVQVLLEGRSWRIESWRHASIAGATAAVWLSGDDAPRVPGRWRMGPAGRVRDRLGDGILWKLGAEISGIGLDIEIRSYGRRETLAFKLGVENRTSRSVRIEAVAPLLLDEKADGRLLAGPEIRGRRVLTDAWLITPRRLVVDDGFHISGKNHVITALDADGDGRGAAYGFITSGAGGRRVETNFCNGCRQRSPEGLGIVARIRHGGRTLWPGERLESAEFAVSFADSGCEAMERFAAAVGARRRTAKLKDPLAGWMSWYAYWNPDMSRTMTEADFIENLDVFAREIAPYGGRVVQIDDEWPAEIGDWEPSARFGRGMEWLARRVHEKGLQAGIWLAPFLVGERSKMFREHPGWLLTGDNGAPRALYRNMWEQNIYGLDATLPAVRRWLKELGAKFRRWGFDVLKIDFENAVADAGRPARESISQTLLASEATGIVARAFGRERHVFCCGGGMMENAGAIDSCRVGRDTGVRWEGVKWAIEAAAGRWWRQGALWANDPDTVHLRSSLGARQVRAWVTVAGLAGGNVMIGDRLSKIRRERFEILSKALPPTGVAARPIDVFTESAPPIWHLHVERDFDSWEVVGFFNMGDGPKTMRLRPEDIGLESGRPCLVFDFWDERFLGAVAGAIEILVPARGCRVLCIRKPAGRPQILSTSRHITQGGVELEGVGWDGKNGRLSGRFRLPTAAEQRLYLYAPPGWGEPEARVSGAWGELARLGGRAYVLKLKTRVPGWVAWQVDFESSKVSEPGETVSHKQRLPAPAKAKRLPRATDGRRKAGLGRLDGVHPWRMEGGYERIDLEGGKVLAGRRTFRRSIGMAGTEARLEYDLDGRARTFKAWAGVSGSWYASRFVFRVFGDGKCLWESPFLDGMMEPVKVAANIEGVRRLRLDACPTMDQGSTDRAFWGDPRLEA